MTKLELEIAQKAKRVERFLAREPEASLSSIAGECGVSWDFAKKIRERVQGEQPGRVEGRNGRIYPSTFNVTRVARKVRLEKLVQRLQRVARRLDGDAEDLAELRAVVGELRRTVATIR